MGSVSAKDIDIIVPARNRLVSPMAIEALANVPVRSGTGTISRRDFMRRLGCFMKDFSVGGPCVSRSPIPDAMRMPPARRRLNRAGGIRFRDAIGCATRPDSPSWSDLPSLSAFSTKSSQRPCRPCCHRNPNTIPVLAIRRGDGVYKRCDVLWTTGLSFPR